MPKTSDPDDAPPLPASSIRSVDRYRVAELEDGSGDDAVLSSITAPPGMVLADLEIEVTGTGSNQADGDARFNWSTSNFRLVDAEGHTMGMVGEQFMRRILDSQFNGVNIGDSTDRNVIWLVPEALTQATLMFGETAVAEVDLGSPRHGYELTEYDGGMRGGYAPPRAPPPQRGTRPPLETPWIFMEQR